MGTFDELKNREWHLRRKMRVEQVRQQTKEIARQLRERTKTGRIAYEEALKKHEADCLRRKKIEEMNRLQKSYSKALEEFGLGHQLACDEDDPNQIKEAASVQNAKVAEERGVKALREELSKNLQEKEAKLSPVRRKQMTRAIEDVRSSLISALPLPSTNELIPISPVKEKILQEIPRNKQNLENSPQKCLETKIRKSPLKKKALSPVNYIQSPVETRHEPSVTSCRSLPTKSEQLQRQVELYDHTSRNTSNYRLGKSLVVKVDYNSEPDVREKNRLEQALCENEEVLNMGDEEVKKKVVKRTCSRGEDAMRKNKLKRDYNRLLKSLEYLSKREKQLSALCKTNIAADGHLDDARRKELNNRKQKQMDDMFDNIYHGQVRTGDNVGDGVTRLNTRQVQDDSTPPRVNVAELRDNDERGTGTCSSTSDECGKRAEMIKKVDRALVEARKLREDSSDKENNRRKKRKGRKRVKCERVVTTDSDEDVGCIRVVVDVREGGRHVSGTCRPLRHNVGEEEWITQESFMSRSNTSEDNDESGAEEGERRGRNERRGDGCGETRSGVIVGEGEGRKKHVVAVGSEVERAECVEDRGGRRNRGEIGTTKQVHSPSTSYMSPPHDSRTYREQDLDRLLDILDDMRRNKNVKLNEKDMKKMEELIRDILRAEEKKNKKHKARRGEQVQLDENLLYYMKILLEMSRDCVSELDVSTVTDISTPCLSELSSKVTRADDKKTYKKWCEELDRVDYDELARRKSARIAELAGMIEQLRREQETLLSTSSASLENTIKCKHSSQAKTDNQVREHKTKSQASNPQLHRHSRFNPQHHLSTIVEVDSAQKLSTPSTQRQQQQEDSFPDVETEMLRRNLIRSPFKKTSSTSENSYHSTHEERPAELGPRFSAASEGPKFVRPRVVLSPPHARFVRLDTVESDSRFRSGATSQAPVTVEDRPSQTPVTRSKSPGRCSCSPPQGTRLKSPDRSSPPPDLGPKSPDGSSPPPELRPKSPDRSSPPHLDYAVFRVLIDDLRIKAREIFNSEISDASTVNSLDFSQMGVRWANSFFKRNQQARNVGSNSENSPPN